MKCSGIHLCALAAILLIVTAKETVSALWVNLSLIRAVKMDLGMFWAVGLPFAGDAESSRWGREFSSEAPNPNWGNDFSALWVRELSKVLGRTVPVPAGNMRRTRILGRLELFAGRSKAALQHLQEVAHEQSRDGCEAKHVACSGLWVDIGDAMDSLGNADEALRYYRAADWLRRREASAALVVRALSDSSFVSSPKVGELLAMLEELLPNSLLAWHYRGLRSGGEQTGYYASLPEDPRIALPTRRDPRLEKQTARAIAELMLQGVWDEPTLARVLAFRAWEVDLHSFDYRNFQVAKVWTPDQERDPMQLAALAGFFNELSNRLPADPFVRWAKGEFYERMGDCMSSALAYTKARQLGLDEAWMQEEPPKNSPCSNHTGGDVSAISQGNALLSANFDLWWSYGQALDVHSVPSTKAGYDDALVGWAWGPDTLYPFESRASFRADCTWQQLIPGKRPAPLFSTLLERGKGQAQTFAIPGGYRLVVDYWWQARGDVGMAYRGREPMVEQEFKDERGWHHTRWVFTPVEHDRTMSLSWQLEGCGSFWLGRLDVRLEPGSL